MKKIEAKIIADSINQQGDRITTYLLTFPRFILAEAKTHRIISGLHGEVEVLEDISINSFREGSKNSASSRAIPFEKMVKMVEEDPFIPIAWQKDHRGMQGTEYITDERAIQNLNNQWLKGRDEAIKVAKSLNRGAYCLEVAKDANGNNMRGFNCVDIPDTSVTKQLCNRLLEPFMWHTTLITATEWENFFNLRCPNYQDDVVIVENNKTTSTIKIEAKSKKEFISKLPKNSMYTYSTLNDLDWLQINQSQAEIHIQALAEAMWDAMNESVPKTLQSGQWHIPFGDKIDYALHKWNFLPNTIELWGKDMSEYGIKVSTARCARLSYMTFDGEIDYEKDIKLHDRLLADIHMSPFEHCARAMNNAEYESFYKGQIGLGGESGWCNNFRGFIPYRYLIENKKINK